MKNSSRLKNAALLMKRVLFNRPHPIRTLHHLSGTGGTLFSKCLAAMNNTALVSEINPNNLGGFRFQPMCLVPQFQKSYGLLSQKNMETFFLYQVSMIYRECRSNNKQLIIRDHAHTDFLGSNISSQPALVSLLQREYPVRSALTFRNPIDSYLSALHNNWWSEQQGFDAYCERVISFLQAYKDTPVFLYEDLINEPENVMRQMCAALELEYTESFIQTFKDIKLSGDSGRGRDAREIKRLPRRVCPPNLVDEANRSKAFQTIRSRWGY